jgi:DNA-binding NarL/FixJ family response regulator
VHGQVQKRIGLPVFYFVVERQSRCLVHQLGLVLRVLLHPDPSQLLHRIQGLGSVAFAEGGAKELAHVKLARLVHEGIVGDRHNTQPCSIRLKPVHLLLIDDHPLIHVALRGLLADLRPSVQVHSAQSAEEASSIMSTLQPEPDLVLLDLQLGDDDGFELLTAFREAHPGMSVVCMSDNDFMVEVIRAIDQGAMGFIPKHMAPDVFRQAVMLVVSGGIYVPPMRVNGDPLVSQGGGRSGLPPPAPRSPALEKLAITPRQHEVLQGLLHGKPNKLIAQELGISADTVKDHVQAIYRVLGVNSRTQAVLAVSQMQV